MPLRLLVVEGNIRASRDAHAAIAGATPSRAYADVLQSLAPDAVCDICLPADAGANLPDRAGLEDYDGVALTGSGLHIYDEAPEIARQISLARAVFASRTPFFGSCWGLQVAVVASGGQVARNPLGREAGIARNIAPTATGAGHPLLHGRAAAFDAPCVHFDHVTCLPPAATILARNGFSPIQAAEIHHDGGAFWGVQYHPEYGLDQLAAIFERGWHSLVSSGLLPDEASARAHCADLRTLHHNRRRADIAWRLGIQPEILDPQQRLTELRNWLDAWVRPEKSRRGRA